MYALSGSACLMNPNVASRVMRNAATAANIAPADCRVHRPGLEGRWPSGRGAQGSVTRHLYRSRCDSSMAAGPSLALNPTICRSYFVPCRTKTSRTGTVRALRDLEPARGFRLAPLIPGALSPPAPGPGEDDPQDDRHREPVRLRLGDEHGRVDQHGVALLLLMFRSPRREQRSGRAWPADALRHHRNRLHLVQRSFLRTDFDGRSRASAADWRSSRNPLAQWSRVVDHCSHAYR